MRGAFATLFLAVLLVLPGTPSHLSAQMDIVTMQLDSAAVLFAGQGFQAVGFRHSGALSEGASERVTLHVASGEYILAGTCDEDCTDLDLRVYNAQGALLDSDTEPDDVPMLAWNLSQGATLSVEVSMFACSIAPCRYGLLLVRRSGAADQTEDTLLAVRQEVDPRAGR